MKKDKTKAEIQQKVRRKHDVQPEKRIKKYELEKRLFDKSGKTSEQITKMDNFYAKKQIDGPGGQPRTAVNKTVNVNFSMSPHEAKEEEQCSQNICLDDQFLISNISLA